MDIYSALLNHNFLAVVDIDPSRQVVSVSEAHVVVNLDINAIHKQRIVIHVGAVEVDARNIKVIASVINLVIFS